jgi:4-hydroxy-3-polyprenylbenzoate decarboxylase
MHFHPQVLPAIKPGIDATCKLTGEGFKRPWLPLVKMDEVVKAKVKQMFEGESRDDL